MDHTPVEIDPVPLDLDDFAFPQARKKSKPQVGFQIGQENSLPAHLASLGRCGNQPVPFRLRAIPFGLRRMRLRSLDSFPGMLSQDSFLDGPGQQSIDAPQGRPHRRFRPTGIDQRQLKSGHVLMGHAGECAISAMVREGLEDFARLLGSARRVLTRSGLFCQVASRLHPDRPARKQSPRIDHRLMVGLHSGLLVLGFQVNWFWSHPSDHGRLIIPDPRVLELVESLELHTPRFVSKSCWHLASHLYQIIDKSSLPASARALISPSHSPTLGGAGDLAQPRFHKGCNLVGTTGFEPATPTPPGWGEWTSCLLAGFVSRFLTEGRAL